MVSFFLILIVDLNVGFFLLLIMVEWLYYLNLEIVVFGYFFYLVLNEDIDFFFLDE